MGTSHWELEQLMGDGQWAVVFEDSEQAACGLPQPVSFDFKEDAQKYASSNWTDPKHVRLVEVRTVRIVLDQPFKT